MKKTFCDRCGNEIKDIRDVEGIDTQGIAGVGDFQYKELCPACVSSFVNWFNSKDRYDSFLGKVVTDK